MSKKDRDTKDIFDSVDLENPEIVENIESEVKEPVISIIKKVEEVKPVISKSSELSRKNPDKLRHIKHTGKRYY